MVANVRSGMLRNVGVRELRDSVDTGQGVSRTGGNEIRQNSFGRGAFINWYDDLGVSTTAPAAKSMREQEAKWQNEYNAQAARVADVRGKLEAAKSEVAGQEGEVNSVRLPEFQNALEDSWQQYKGTLTPVRVMGPGEKIEETYYVPKDVADKFASSEGVYSAWYGPYLNIEGKDYANGYVHKPLREAQSMTETMYKEKAQGPIAEQLGIAQDQLSSAANMVGSEKEQLSNYEGQVANAEGMLAGMKQKHDQQWDELHQRYNDRRDKMNEILGSLFVGDK